jgi:hypothetical protein
MQTPANGDILHIEGDTVRAVSPEGKEATMPVEAFVRQCAGAAGHDVVLPDGVKCEFAHGPLLIWVHELTPRVHRFKWIAPDSPQGFGRGTRYREVRLALPYVVTFAVFVPGPDGRLTLGRGNECFFRTAPLANLEDELFYPALLNCSKSRHPDGQPLAWICTQHLDWSSFHGEADTGRRLRAGFGALMHCLLDTGFNYSSEAHEGASWFGESRGVDPRVATVEAWQAASEQNPLFPLEVPWLPSGHTVRQLAGRIANHGAARPRYTDAGSLARLVFRQRDGSSRRRGLLAKLGVPEP